MTTQPQEKTEPLYALGLIIQALKFVHEEYADEIKGSSTYQARLTKLVRELSIICTSDINALYRAIGKAKGNLSEEHFVSPYYAATDFVKEMIEVTMLMADVQNGGAIEAGRDVLRHIKKQIEEGPKPPKKRAKKEVTIHPLTGQIV